MKLILERLISNEDETIGKLSIDGLHYCWILEDEFREEKVTGETRIPAGTYDIKIRNEGGMTKRYAKRLGKLHRGMIWLQDVPNFEWVYIHIGNEEDHTDGCLLTGVGVETPIDRRWKTTRSTDAYVCLAQLIYEALDNNEAVTIEIIDKDR